LGFERPLPPGGYAWWYVDGLSDDGREGITLIAFIGSVFSPYYAFARRRGPTSPFDHCALNVALYRPRGGRWAMTERPAGRITAHADGIVIGPSAIEWTGDTLRFRIAETTFPIPTRIRGEVILRPRGINETSFELDLNARHRWWPVAPVADIEVRLERPSLHWRGVGYFDSNWGAAPLEDDFIDWHWSRTPGRKGAAVHYDVARRDGSEGSLALRFDMDGTLRDADRERPGTTARLPATGWRIARHVRTEDAGRTRLHRTLEDTPFYARSLVRTSLEGADAMAMHESLSLDRFRNPVVQLMLPFRMPRSGR